MNRKINFAPGEFYHIYSRGVEKRKIFIDESDRKRFIALLFYCNDVNRIVMRDLVGKGSDFSNFKKHKRDTLVDIGAYCLMSNHFHILIHEKKDNGICLFMQKLLTAYTMYFNKKNNRVGPLFQSRFQAQHADEDEYLKFLYSYIHLNPVKLFQPGWVEEGIDDIKATKKYLASYEYSSYVDYLGIERVENALINKDAFPEYFEEAQDFSKLVDDSINYYNIYHPLPRSGLGGCDLGDTTN